MSRIVFWVALAVLVWFAIRAKLRANARRSQAHVPPRQESAAPPVAIENMTSCAYCGLHFPSSEAVHADGRDYCSPAHVRLPPAQP